MRCVTGVAAAFAFAVAYSGIVTPALAETAAIGREEPRFLFFAGTDMWRHGGFGHGGMLWSPKGLDGEGPVLKLMFGGGAYRYNSGALGNAEVAGRLTSAGITPGWRFIRPGMVVTIFAGLDLQRHRLTPDDPSAGLHGSYAGARTGFEFWYQPSANTMIAANASVSSIGPSYSARLAAGWRVFERFYVGPELQAFAADDNYRQVRAGVHVTGFKNEPFEWSAGLGWAGDSDSRGSAYGKFGVITRR